MKFAFRKLRCTPGAGILPASSGTGFLPAILSFITLTLILTVSPSLTFAENPKSLGHDLFNLTEFVRVKRNARLDRLHKDTWNFPASSSVSSSVQSSSSSTSSELQLGDLSSTERDAIRRQLRVGACPEHADSAYLKLCEKLLKLQKPRNSQQGISVDRDVRNSN